MSELSSQIRQDQAEMESLHMTLQQREERVDELMREQDREEDQVYAKDNIIERLRKRLTESEKSRIEAEKRYQDQVSLCVSQDGDRMTHSPLSHFCRRYPPTKNGRCSLTWKVYFRLKKSRLQMLMRD